MIEKIGRDTAPAAPSRASSPAEAEGKRDEFRQAMRQNADRDEPEGRRGTRGQALEAGAGDEKTEGSPLPAPFSGDALLRALGPSYAPLETQAPALETPALAAELAERILVNTDNRAEVRITLKDSVLPDTEVILRQEGARLVVQLVSPNPASLEALRLAQDDLRNKLLALGRDFSVEVLDSRGREGDSEPSGGRSRGLDYLEKADG